MDGTGPSGGPSWLGRVTIDDSPVHSETAAKGTPASVRRSRYTWWPGPELAGDLPADFRLDLECLTGPDGSRRFRPADGFDVFLAKASLGGLAVLNRTRRPSAEQRYSYDAMRLFFRQVPRLREHLARV